MRAAGLAVACLLSLGIFCAGEARAQFAVSTSPDPVPAGTSFRVTVAGMYLPNAIGSPRQSVIVEGSTIRVFLGRACEFVCGPKVFDSVAFTAPPLAAGRYAVAIHQGEPSASASGPPDVETTLVVSGPNYRGLWWGSPAGSESGWGLSIEHQGDILFAVWFTYEEAGKGQWLVMPRGVRGPSGYAGELYRTTGPVFSASPWSAAAVQPVPVGSASVSFEDGGNGTFTYVLGGVQGTKRITRQAYAAPMPTCLAGDDPARSGPGT